jgi:rSAM/selenodomain-associated transferase 1
MKYICIYSKPPIPGKTKSRLADDIGEHAAAELAAAMLKDICDVSSQLDDANVQLWHPPDHHRSEFAQIVPQNFEMRCQEGDNLGERMNHTLSQLLENRKENRAIIVGSDCITCSNATFLSAFSILEKADVVIQPSHDGGYVLIGQSVWRPTVFNNIKWGTNNVMAESLLRIEQNKIRCTVMAPTFDIDTASDLLVLREFIKEHRRPHTAKWFAENHRCL